MRPSSWLLTGTLLLLAACAHAKRWTGTPQCRELCTRITSCAAKTNHSELGPTLCHIAACESGKFCAHKEVRSPDGLYHGHFQFVKGTWRAVCMKIFRSGKIEGCADENSIYDPCCQTMCAAEIIARDLNGGIKNWPVCGPQALREINSEKK